MPNIPQSQSRAQAQHALNVYSSLSEPDESKRRNMTAKLTGLSRVQVNTALGNQKKFHLEPEPIDAPSKIAAEKLVAVAMPVPPKIPLTPAEALESERQDRQESAEIKALRTKLKESEHQNDLKSQQLSVMLGLKKASHENIVIVPPRIATSGQGVFCAVASDWHLEEDVDPRTINGANEYNPEISEKRAKKFFESFIFMLTAWRKVGLCDTAVLAILGDIISGYIHEELMESNHMSPSKASLFAIKILSAGIRYILQHGGLKKLIIPCCYGNHGRTTLKSRIQTGADNSYEYLMYCHLAQYFENEPRVQFIVSEGYHNIVTLPGATIRFHHGDSISYGGGIGGITIPVSKKIHRWNDLTKANLDVFGHFHQLLDGGNFICNGSLIGYNAYALSIAASAERPRQSCFWIDSKLGKTMSGELFVV